MTLAIVWRENGTIKALSDSRITLSETKCFDRGIKIVTVPISVISAADTNTGNSELMFSSAYGFIYAGSTLNAYLTKELVSDFMSNIQPIGEHSVSFDTICQAIEHFSTHISKELCFQTAEKGIVEFVLTGVCPDSKLIKAAKFSLSSGEDGIEVNYNSVLDQDGQIEILGDGRRYVEDKINGKPSNEYISLIEEVIANESAKTVGGVIQYGALQDGVFKVSGRIVQKMVGSTLVNEYLIRGVDLNQTYKFLHNLGIHVRYSFIQDRQIDQCTINKAISDHYAGKSSND
ncbi:MULTISPECIES: hypothetical protein [Marinomonas]|uniref:Uncharacterized protein n=1 Tax=Marinomonas arctica TaxID=383750 RepID=A0A7H1J200_9GAMM|nr:MULTISPECIES: hypothetical protein [Marinomonas]MCS7488237.1 hypothetical protein [Marinomonas sp. BSi20414]QNT04516.1 hypothetical protein IBG28_12370 [Marinomonas arctica]GGN37044.1 hypothetical protein GCM10011350_35810 [Marinomonas arctica]